MDLTLKTNLRTLINKKSKSLRKKGILPAVIYGHGIENKNIEIKKSIFQKLYKQVGDGSLLDLIIDGQKPIKVLIQEIQKDPVKSEILHIDFYQIKKGEKITHSIKLNFIGESKAIKELGGVLIRNVDSVEIECLPEDLISEIDVNISCLNTFEDIIHIKDLKIPLNIKILDKLDEIVSAVVPPKREEKKEVVEEKKEEEKKEPTNKSAINK
ncbi:50S ribosomal protein L25 [Candidatus Kuenenbacteria bacterium HGW-Kuenenbacteria-1]|uniref:Large ribosomal subunit protein bL25 n=1 Tax=Candidatus Kuenenbacteria bacterium HGW-Kuenenbacteria-1 TaxID=2013812 RepID=A0A2N1UPB0_9BACT|nr:MAG: 50S ribosomal protein L25 [Candidatus Kuenenbacteria bacterium HGW-Kuenenbacteria-1]